MARCVACQRENPEGARFCLHCGTPFATDGADGEAEVRKVVSVVFVDLVGFTSIAERLDVEDVRALLVPYHTRVRSELERHGGVVEKFIGDAIVGIFGVPAAHEDDAERAVRAALAIRRAVSTAVPRDPLELHVRIGVTTGEALVDLRARPSAGDPTVTGDVVNTASRLQGLAPSDGILVNEATQRLTRDQIVYDDWGERPLRGKGDPIRVWAALRAHARRGEDASRLHETRLVDRRAERDALVAALERALALRRLELATIAGAAGIGKSRLVRELFDYVEALPDLIQWRQGRTLAYGEAATFSALSDMVKAHIGALESDRPAETEAKLRRAVEAAVGEGGESAWLCTQLGPLVGVGSDTELRGDRRAEAFGGWRRFLETIATQKPLVLVFEDLHWAHDDLLSFIEHLVAWATDVPLLIVCTMRSDLLDRRLAWLSGGETATLLALRPLTGDQIEELLRELLGGQALPAGARAALVSHAEGNPLFAHEYVRMLIDQRRLVQSGDSWHLDDASTLDVPQSLAAIVAARLDTLSAEERRILQDAAVVGRRLWPGAVAAVADRGTWAVADVLRRLESRELLRRAAESRVHGEMEYVFQHAIIGDVAYGQILRVERAQKHRRAAAWIESLSEGRRHHAETLVHHYTTAIECARAVGQEPGDLDERLRGALIEAAERALSLHSYSTAADFAARALTLCDGSSEERPRLLLTHGLALAMADRPAVATLEEASRSLAAAGDRERAAEAQSTLGWLHAAAGSLERAGMADRQALELVRDLPPSRAKASVLVNAASHMVFMRERRPEGLRLLTECLAEARELNLPELEAEALEFRGLGRLDEGEAEGLADLEHAVEVAARTASPSLLSCLGNLTDVRRRLGQIDAAGALQERGLQHARRFGVPASVRRFTVERIVGAYYAGRWHEAGELVARYLDAVEAGSPHYGEVDARIIRARMRAAREDAEGAAADTHAALAYARQNAEEFDLLPALAAAVGAGWRLGRTDVTADALELLDRLAAGQPMWAAWTLPDVLPAVVGLGLAGELRPLIARATPRTAWYPAAEAVLDGDHATAASLYRGVGSRPDEAGAHLLAARSARDAGLAREAAAHLASAADFYRSVGAGAGLADADALAAAVRPAAP